MANIHGLYSNNNNNNNGNHHESDDSDDDPNERYVGGVNARGGGSGLAVTPNVSNDIRENATVLGDGEGPPRHTITMYRSGFIVDDNGVYRRLDDPANAIFLSALARGMIPPELSSSGSGGNVTVGLVDKRNEEYVEQQQSSFTGTGNVLGSTTINATDDGVVTSSVSENAPTLDTSRPHTRIMLRLANGKREVLKVNLDWLLSTILSLIPSSEQPFILSAGFPPTILTNYAQTIQEAGLENAQLIQKLV
uniref:UBX domain-containing protein n=1 Tax=Eucampia antarctica TaxID=49252 RepID=A0A7S2VZR9_9STRA|eukprot:CAMPEP_0197828730 /NCGR_PEP_ID=MMETSP1437-20131217/5259_1 /TAXON_ID=49252 ORGANISM="Eucampia antarctica, Strain CCMP1452" /NCGR_SAMPLE_ID=MMETSP1437 /ASSEMBLY_ACC=CAM_ASM_001096 /LENGTH=249 /DNA_ID=CAMNT_0043430073 /DNA_START=45 /DNA_END=794 /DNA_ORIENTATION=-